MAPSRKRSQRLAVGHSVTFCLLAAASLLLSTALESSGLAGDSKVTLSKMTETISPMRDAVIQNTPGYSEGYAVGVPRNFAWYCGYYKPTAGNVPPPGFTAVTGWGQIYPKDGAPEYTDPKGSVTISNAKTYVHLSNTREWILVQSQGEAPIAGGHFVADFSGNAAREMKVNALPGGSVVLDLPPNGYNNHFWVVRRGAYSAGSVDGVYVQMDMKTNDPSIKLVANVGADWWRSPTARYVDGFANNPGAGMSNWVELSTAWSTLRFYSWNTSRLRANPPPPLEKKEPTVNRRRPNNTSLWQQTSNSKLGAYDKGFDCRASINGT
jgi:hypothetical protein